jgi:NADPH-dependent 2,4-dienoyl-CoA reductase/sulfur reductase-like enzyme
MRIVIVGSVAAGTSVGAKARRNTEAAEIVIFERDSDICYSGCGLPSGGNKNYQSYLASLARRA